MEFLSQLFREKSHKLPGRRRLGSGVERLEDRVMMAGETLFPTLDAITHSGSWGVDIAYADMLEGSAVMLGDAVIPLVGSGNVGVPMPSRTGWHEVRFLDPERKESLLMSVQSNAGRSAATLSTHRVFEELAHVSPAIVQALAETPELLAEVLRDSGDALAGDQGGDFRGAEMPPETITVIPSLHAVTKSGSWGVDVTYEYALAGAAIVIGGERIALEPGSGAVGVPLPARSGEYDVYFIDADGSETKILSVGSNSGRSTRTAEHTEVLPSRTEAAAPKMTEALQEPVVESVEEPEEADLSAADSAKEDAVEAITVTPSLHAVTKSGSWGVDILYENMPEGASVVLGDQEIPLPPGSGKVGVPMPSRSGWHEVHFFDAESRDTLLMRVQSNAGRSAETLESSHVFEEMKHTAGEVERRIEVPNTEPDLSVVALKGPNVLLALRSPYNQSVVALQGGGLFSEKRLTHIGGTDMTLVTLSMGGDNPTGEYALTFYGGNTGKKLAWFPLFWDHGRKTLSNPDESHDISPAFWAEHADELEFSRQRFSEHMSLKSIDASGTSIERIQGERLYAQSTFFVPGENATAILRKTLPHIFVEDLEATVEARAEAENNTRGNIRTHIVSQQSEYLGILNRKLGTYQEVMGTILQKGMEVIVAARSGRSEAAARDVLQQEIDRARKLPVIVELDALAGIRIPEVTAVIADCVRMEEMSLDGFLRVQAKISDVRVREQESRNDVLAAEREAAERREITDAFLTDVNRLLREAALGDAVPAFPRVGSEQSVIIGGVRVAMGGVLDVGLWNAAAFQESVDALKDGNVWTGGELPECPCTVGEVLKEYEESPGMYILDPAARYFHEGSFVGFRSAAEGRAGIQCTYDDYGRLITSGPGAGSTDASMPDTIADLFLHFIEDVIPSAFLMVEEYARLRPINDGVDCPVNPE